MTYKCIEIENLSKRFSEKEVLNDLSLTIDKGAVFGLVGLNGAGKTTLIRLLLGLLEPDRGKCSVLGLDPSRQQKRYYQRIGVVLEHNGFFGNLTLAENMTFFAHARGVTRSQLEEYVSSFWSHTTIGTEKRKVKYFSRGQKMQCALCRAFLGWPEVFFFDEPVAALDLSAYDHFCTMVRQAQTHGATILISSHQLDTIEELCTDIGILENGTVSLYHDHTDCGTVPWVIRTEADTRCGDIITSEAKSSAEFTEGVWRVGIVASEAHTIISSIIERLVHAGIAVYEVYPEKKDFKNSMRTYFKKIL